MPLLRAFIAIVITLTVCYAWGTLCSVLIDDPDLSLLPSMVGGFAIGWFGFGMFRKFEDRRSDVK